MDTQYKVMQLIADERPWLDHVHQVLQEHAREGWELVTAFPYEGAGPRGLIRWCKACRTWPAPSSFLNGWPNVGRARPQHTRQRRGGQCAGMPRGDRQPRSAISTFRPAAITSRPPGIGSRCSSRTGPSGRRATVSQGVLAEQLGYAC